MEVYKKEVTGNTVNYQQITTETVIANPTAEGTEQLQKLQVGNTVYNMPEGGGGNYVLELTGESGTLTDEQYQAVVDNFPNVVVNINAGENYFIALPAVVDFSGMYAFGNGMSDTGERISCNTCIVNTDKSYMLMHYDFTIPPSSGLQVKQITFTDRPSLYSWLQSNYEKAIKTIVTLGGNKYDLTENFIRVDVEDIIAYKGSVVQVGVDNNVTDIRFTYIYITDAFITANMGGSIFSIDGTSSTVNEANAQIVSDELWTSYGINVTITYIE